LPFLAGSVVDVVADVVTVVLVVPVVPIVAEVPEVSAVVNMSLLLVPVVADMVLVVDDTAVSVVTVSVLAFSCFLQPNANRATASRAKTATERDFFIRDLLKATGELQREDVSGMPLTWRYIRNVVANVKRTRPPPRRRLALRGLL
jgi:hypothetical protein